MYIDRITLYNFKVYKGKNILHFSLQEDKNISIITGNNGFGKTSLLTSLVWCLYGKLMGEVDERYRKEIYENGGYKSYCKKLLNISAVSEHVDTPSIWEEQQSLFPAITERTKSESSFSVSIRFKKIFVPAISCNDLEVVRTYDTRTNTETLDLLIDGQPNELTKQVGNEIFINDYVLKKEVAKFFFFDAEKIVELAEVRSLEEKRMLSRAYGEVLGIKKYIDLKENLENLRLRLRKKNASATDREKLEKLSTQHERNVSFIEHLHTVVNEKEDELVIKRQASDTYQEQLIREGTSITVEELKELRQMKDNVQEENSKVKDLLKDMLELAPLAILANKMSAVKEQIYNEKEQNNQTTYAELLNKKADELKDAFQCSSAFSLPKGDKKKLYSIIEKVLSLTQQPDQKILLDFSKEQENKFFAVYENLHYSFSKDFKSVTSDLRVQHTTLSMLTRKLSNAESKEKDPIIKAIRDRKTVADEDVRKLEKECIDVKAEIIAANHEQNNIGHQISELQKKVHVENIDSAKDEAAAKLIEQLNDFIVKLKIKKKGSLEEKLLRQLHILMHKPDFIKHVEIVIEGELIDIELYDKQKNKINKDNLSKGEQQLYATALLKALVDESDIRFPVFIDSPLQKFDRTHSQRIIEDFYPYASAQVILFPLLEKELNKDEFSLLHPKVSDCYLIQHTGQYQSTFQKIQPEQLFEMYQTHQEEYVYH